jgi:hypothetical protein
MATLGYFERPYCLQCCNNILHPTQVLDAACLQLEVFTQMVCNAVIALHI